MTFMNPIPPLSHDTVIVVLSPGYISSGWHVTLTVCAMAEPIIKSINSVAKANNTRAFFVFILSPWLFVHAETRSRIELCFAYF